jgi:hypothetical protein
MMPAFRRNPDRPHGVRAALAALFSFLASRPALASLAMVEVHAAGPAALELREEGLRPLSILLGEASVRSGRMPDVGYEGIVGAVLHLAEDQLRRGEAAGLPTLTPLCAYIALAPLLGAEAACAVANGEGDTRGAGRLDPHAVRAAGRDPIQRLAILALVRGPLGVPALAESLGRPEAEVTKHLEELVGTGVLERGADPASGEDVYRYPLEALDAERWGELDADERRRFSERIARLIDLELHQSLDSGEFDRVPETVIVRLALLLDEQGWREISDLHSDFMWSVLRAQEESHKRMAVTGEKGIEARTVQLHFRLPQ